MKGVAPLIDTLFIVSKPVVAESSFAGIRITFSKLTVAFNPFDAISASNQVFTPEAVKLWPAATLRGPNALPSNFKAPLAITSTLAAVLFVYVLTVLLRMSASPTINVEPSS